MSNDSCIFGRLELDLWILPGFDVRCGESNLMVSSVF